MKKKIIIICCVLTTCAVELFAALEGTVIKNGDLNYCVPWHDHDDCGYTHGKEGESYVIGKQEVYDFEGDESVDYTDLVVADIADSIIYYGTVYPVTCIGWHAFQGCSKLNSVIIPKTVTRIADGAFENCEKLSSLTIYGNNLLENITKCGINQNTCTLYVPGKYIETYTQATWWKDFTNIKPIPGYFVATVTSNNPSFGTVYHNELNKKDSVYLVAEPSYGCHFVQWSDGKTDNPRIIVLTQDTAFEAIFARNPIITYKYDSEQGYIEGAETTPTGEATGNITFTAYPKRGYHFVSWADGNTDNPRTIELIQDTIIEVLFDYTLSGNCGKDNVLTWKLDKAIMSLEITGKGALSDNFSYTYSIESVTIGNEITSIGEYAFQDCSKLKKIIIGSSVKVIEEDAFEYCYDIATITCYSMRPPTVNNGAFENLDYSTIIYVPADYLNTYKMHDFWGLYDVRPLGAESVQTDEVKVESSANSADVTWPAVENAYTYELVIKDKQGNVICTLTFNANGQLTSIAFNAPARNNAAEQIQTAGFSFTVTGLQSGTTYDLTITAKDSNDQILQTTSQSFTTAELTDVADIVINIATTKVIRNGQLFILRGDKTYTIQGQEVR